MPTIRSPYITKLHNVSPEQYKDKLSEAADESSSRCNVDYSNDVVENLNSKLNS